MRTEYYFTNTNDPKLILDAITETRNLWDDGLDCFDEIEGLRTEHTSVHRLLMNSVLNLSQREFIDKKIYFTRAEAIAQAKERGLLELEKELDQIEDNSDDIFVWTTSAPNDLYPICPNFTRSDSIVGIMRIGRIATWPPAQKHLDRFNVDYSNGGCYSHYISQTDVKIGKWTQKMLLPIIPKQLQAWGEGLRKYLEEGDKGKKIE